MSFDCLKARCFVLTSPTLSSPLESISRVFPTTRQAEASVRGRTHGVHLRAGARCLLDSCFCFRRLETSGAIAFGCPGCVDLLSLLENPDQTGAPHTCVTTTFASTRSHAALNAFNPAEFPSLYLGVAYFRAKVLLHLSFHSCSSMLFWTFEKDRTVDLLRLTGSSPLIGCLPTLFDPALCSAKCIESFGLVKTFQPRSTFGKKISLEP